jgi:UbiD family decarboxylase
MHRAKYFEKGKPCPMVSCFGVDPLLHMIATRPEPYGKCELAVGGIKGEPVEVIEGEFTGLPIPAYAEIAGEAEMLPNQEEGPFSEWTRYYASGEKTEPVIKVHRLYHRNDPITASPEYRPTARAEHCYELLRAAYIRDQVEKADVPDVKGVASYFRGFLDSYFDPPALFGARAPGGIGRQPMPGRRLFGAICGGGRRLYRRL